MSYNCRTRVFHESNCNDPYHISGVLSIRNAGRTRVAYLRTMRWKYAFKYHKIQCESCRPVSVAQCTNLNILKSINLRNKYRKMVVKWYINLNLTGVFSI